MIVTIEQIKNGIVRYIENEIAVKATGITKFMAYFIIPSVPTKLNDFIQNYHSFLIPYFDENGNVRIDELYSSSKSAMQRALQFEYSGIVFKEHDIDLLYRYITE